MCFQRREYSLRMRRLVASWAPLVSVHGIAIGTDCGIFRARVTRYATIASEMGTPEIDSTIRRGAPRPKRVHTSDRRSLAGTSLAAETDESRDEESRLKAGCSQDWLPHKARGFLATTIYAEASMVRTS